MATEASNPYNSSQRTSCLSPQQCTPAKWRGVARLITMIALLSIVALVTIGIASSVGTVDAAGLTCASYLVAGIIVFLSVFLVRRWLILRSAQASIQNNVFTFVPTPICTPTPTSTVSPVAIPKITFTILRDRLTKGDNTPLTPEEYLLIADMALESAKSIMPNVVEKLSSWPKNVEASDRLLQAAIETVMKEDRFILTPAAGAEWWLVHEKKYKEGDYLYYIEQAVIEALSHVRDLPFVKIEHT